jgi:hypothetical protein
VAFGTFTARAYRFDSAVFVAWQEDGRRTLCRLSGREEREAAEAVARGDCEAVRRICRGAVKVQLALGGPGADLWERVRAIEWQPESADASDFVEWHSSVAAGAGKLAEDFRKIEEATDSWRRSGGALSWWKRDRSWVRKATESWKRHSTPGEIRKLRIQSQRARDEAARARSQGVEEGSLRRIVEGGRLGSESAEARTADLGTGWTSSVTVDLSSENTE